MPLRLHEVATIASAGLGTVRTVRVPEGQVWCIERTEYQGSSVPSGGNTRARVYIGGHGPKFYVREQQTPTAGNLYQVANEYHIYPGEWVAMEWDEAQADATLDLWVIGYFWELEVD